MDTPRHPLPRQGLLFLAAGLAQLVLDTALFVGLTALGMPLVAGNVAGRVSGACLGFFLNGRYTFASTAGPRLDRRHLGRFVLVWCLLTILSTALLAWVGRQAGLHGSWLAKPLVETAMAIVGFLSARHWIYR